ncbi:MAG: YfdX family protein [Chromatiales bacterium]|jgi:hypothetical protein
MNIRSFAFKPLVAALLVASVVAGNALANSNSADNNSASSNIKEDVNVLPGRQISPQDEAMISTAAVKVLRHIASARGALRGENPNIEQAKAELDQSDKLLDIIQETMPTTKIKDHIWVAKKHLEYENTSEVLPDLVPIYSSLDELVDYVPTGNAKAHLNEAKNALEQGDKSKATEHLQEANDALLYVEADLPLSVTRQLVAQAKGELAKGDSEAADKLLHSAEESVVFVSISYHSPLIQAKAALWRASQDYLLEDKSLAKTDLDQAVKYLEQAAQSDDQVTRQAAAKLVSDVREIHQMIESGDEGLSERLVSTLGRVRALSERSVEYISTGWQRLRAEGKGKKDLIEAKLQLSYARIDHFSANDNAAAKVDLAEARGYLDTAAKQVKTEVKPKVEAVSNLIDTIETALQQDDLNHSNKLAFDQAESKLINLIRQI